jgi:hypothetical protein
MKFFMKFFNNYLKKSQISVFIIIGFLILISVFLFIYLNNINTLKFESKIPENLILIDSVVPVRIYFESCIEQLAREPIEKLGLYGGSLDPLNYKLYNGHKYNYLCQNQYGFGCINSLVLREDMEKQISKYIMENFHSCANLKFFELQGFKIDKGDLLINTKITKENVIINAYFPITFSKKNQKLVLEYFSSQINVPLGELYDISLLILNSEIKKDYFDHVKYMVNYNDLNNQNIIIEKHKPFPDIVYNLKKYDYNFNFAIEGSSNIELEKLFFSDNLMSQNGCCYISYDNTCFKNALKILCEIKGGTYDQNSLCNCGIDFDVILNNNVNINESKFNNCKNTYDYVSGEFSLKERFHGESWCGYDSIVGNGLDYVGSRHYMHYCIDGIEYVEECKDFRKEICVSNLINNSDIFYSKAMCKPNRWENCYLCDTKECCENKEYMDCVWNENLTTQKKCAPFVPPGFKHWEGEGKEYCSIANEKRICYGSTCNNSFVNDNLDFCFMQGDCGNYRNIMDKKTDFGFFHTDLKAIVDNSLIPNEGFIKKGNEQIISFNYSSFNRQRLIDNNFDNNFNAITGILISFYSFLDQLSKISSNNIEDDFTVTNFALCSLWEVPFGGDDCNKCDGGYFRPCTEYKCKSLGKECIYEEINGFSYCTKKETYNMDLPIITINYSLTDDFLKLKEKEIIIDNIILRGYETKDNLSSGQMINIGINTKKETTCKMSFIPKNEIFSVMSNPIGNNFFSVNHKISLKIPPSPKIPDNLFGLLNTNSSNFLDSILNLKNNIINNPNENDLLQKIFLFIFGKDSLDDNKKKSPFVNLFLDDSKFSRKVINLLFNKINNGGYFIFFYCSDKSGQENIHPFFIEINIDENFNKKNPPIFLGAIPKNNSYFGLNKKEVLIELFFNEPSDCRYSLYDTKFENMNDSFDCVYSNYQISSNFQGSYSCKKNIMPIDDKIELFIRCKDSPIISKQLIFDLTISNQTIQETLLFNDDLIKKTNYSVSFKNHSLVYYINEKNNCTFIPKSFDSITGNCMLSNNLNLGLYMCIFDYDFSKFIFNEINEKINVNIVCNSNNNTNYNVHNQSIIYNIFKSNKLEIIDYGPKNDIRTIEPLLYVETTNSSNVQCGFYSNKNLGIYAMNNIVDFKFSKILSNLDYGKHNYYVNCIDSYGNEAIQEIEFYIIE